MLKLTKYIHSYVICQQQMVLQAFYIGKYCLYDTIKYVFIRRNYSHTNTVSIHI